MIQVLVYPLTFGQEKKKKKKKLTVALGNKLLGQTRSPFPPLISRCVRWSHPTASSFLFYSISCMVQRPPYANKNKHHAFSWTSILKFPSLASNLLPEEKPAVRHAGGWRGWAMLTARKENLPDSQAMSDRGI